MYLERAEGVCLPAGHGDACVKASVHYSPGIPDPVELADRTSGNHGDPTTTDKEARRRVASVKSEDVPERGGKSERPIGAEKPGNSGGAKGAQQESTSGETCPRHRADYAHDHRTNS